MPYLVLFNRLSFQRVDPRNPKVPAGDPIEVQRGGFVPEWVTPFEVNALMNAGMITAVESKEAAPEIRPIEDIPASPRTPDQPNLLPSDPNGFPPVVDGQGVEVVGDGGEPFTGLEPVVAKKPGITDNKLAWENYAASPAIGMDRAEAESLSKAKLMERVSQIEQDRNTPPA